MQLGVPVDSLESTHYRSLLGSARVEVDSWRGKEYLKPRGYDCKRGVQLPSGIGACGGVEEVAEEVLISS